MPLNNERRTKQKEAIKTVLSEQKHPLLPEEIHQLALKSVPSLGIATVYRSIKNLMEDGQGSAPWRFQAKPHATNVPTRAITTISIAGSARKVFDLQKRVEGVKNLAPSGFRVTDHEIILYGLCKRCAR